MPMFPPEEIAAAQQRERERERQLARTLAELIAERLRTEDEVSSVAVLDDGTTVAIELTDGSEFFAPVTPA